MNSETLSLKAIINELDLLKKEVIIQWNVIVKKKDLLLLETKLIEKIPDPSDAEEQYQSFVRKKNTESAKQSEVITYQPKSFENPSIVDVKSVIIEHPKTSHKFSKTEKVSQVGSNSSLHSDTKKKWKFFKWKKYKNNKTSTWF